MTCLVVLVFLLMAASLKPHLANGKSHWASFGNNLNLKANNNEKLVSNCSVTHNDFIYEIFPDFRVPNAVYDFNDEHECDFELKSIDFDSAGKWEIIIQFQDSSVQTFNHEVIVSQAVSGEYHDATKLTIAYDDYANIFFPEYFPDPVECSLYKKEGKQYVLKYNITDATSEMDGIEIREKCDLRMRVTRTTPGHWLIMQKFGPYKIRNFYFEIEKMIKKNNTIEERQWWEAGSDVEWKLMDQFGHCSYIQIRQPDGYLIPLVKTSISKYKIENVSAIHAGTWTFYCGMPTDINPKEFYYHVTVVDPREIDVSVTYTDKSVSRTLTDIEIHLLCKTYVKEINFCTFTSPTDKVVNVLMNVANEKYEYYGKGFQMKTPGKFAECGLTIRNVTTEDLGLWKCTVGNIGSERQRLGAIVSTGNLTPRGLAFLPLVTRKINNTVYVKRGDNFTIQCMVNTPLRYCWLKSPNGTIYSVTKDGSLRNSLRYVGESLAVGDCRVNIENADDTHSGNWYCGLGVVENAEIESIVPVTVTESYITPLEDNVVATADNKDLACQVLPGRRDVIQYCRWVRPNGRGISVHTADKYRSQQLRDTCKLTINNWTREDIGTWRCYARLATKPNEEYYATINVSSQVADDFEHTLLIVIVVLVSLLLIITSYIGVILLKRKNFTIKNKVLPWNRTQDVKIFSYPEKIDPTIKC